MAHLSLSERVKLAFVLSFLALSAVSVILLFAATKILQDHIFESQLKQQIEHFRHARENNLSFTLPNEITVFQSLSDMPDGIARYIEHTEPGYYELNLPNELDYHYGVADFANGERLLFLFEVNNIELSDEAELELFQLIAVGFVLLLVCFFLFFRLVLNRSLKPMYQLIHQVKAQHNQPDKSLNYQYPMDDELGLLHETIKNYSERIASFVEREREFSGFASHELRTPVTVIKGATELLELQSKQFEPMSKPLKRIERAVNNMEEMIEMLLSLSREHHRVESAPLPLTEVYQRTLVNLEGKLNACGKSITTAQTDGETAMVESTPAQIVIGNLLRNAIEHGCDQHLKVTLTRDTLEIINQFNTQETELQQGYGLGIMIVERICTQQSWPINRQQKVTSDIKGTFAVSVKFNSSVGDAGEAITLTPNRSDQL